MRVIFCDLTSSENVDSKENVASSGGILVADYFIRHLNVRVLPVVVREETIGDLEKVRVSIAQFILPGQGAIVSDTVVPDDHSVGNSTADFKG